MRRSLITVPILVVAIAFSSGAGAFAAPPDSPGKSDHERIVGYWTSQRVERARPRDVDRAPHGQGKPIRGGSAETGANWTGGGLVKTTTGRVLFTMSGIDYVCSGSIVADERTDTSLVLTAGHCAYDEAKNQFATNWMFVPDYEANATFSCANTVHGCWTAQALVTTAAWAGGDFDEDYAYAVIRPGGKSGTTQLDSLGIQAISFTLAAQSRPVHAFGYPAARPYNGQRLVYCAGDTVADPYGSSTDWGLNCDMTGGSSGGPWFANFDPATGRGTLTSVNSFKYRGLSAYMFGPYFDVYGAKTYTGALAATTNTLVTP